MASETYPKACHPPFWANLVCFHLGPLDPPESPVGITLLRALATSLITCELLFYY